MNQNAQYEVKFGNWMQLLALCLCTFIGTLITRFFFLKGGEVFHDYVLWLGWFVVLSIGQSHDLQPRNYPHASGLIRYPITIIAAYLIHLGTQSFCQWGRIDPFYGPVTFILLGFYFLGVDDFIFGGRIAQKLRAGRIHANSNASEMNYWFSGLTLLGLRFCCIATIWQAVRLILVQLSGFEFFFAFFQWSVIGLLMIAVPLKDLLRLSEQKLKWQLVAFFSTFGFGLFMAGFLYIFSWRLFAITGNTNWHLVLIQGTFPLCFVVLKALYGKGYEVFFPDKSELDVFGRTIGILIRSGLWFLVFSLGIIRFFPGATLTSHNPGLAWSFTCAIILYTWYWYTRRWLVLKKV